MNRLFGVAAVVVVLLVLAGTTTAPADAETSGTRQLRLVVINGIGELGKMLREIDGRKKKPPTSELDVWELQILYWGPLALKNSTTPKIRRAGGHSGLQRAAIRFFTQVACWGTHSSSMIGWANKGRRAAAERESRAATGCMARARVAQEEVSRLLNATA